MNKIKTISLLMPTFILLFVLLTSYAFAICPACCVAVGAGVGLSRWLGIDDIISGVWIGGLVLSSALWLISWLEKKINFRFMKILVLVLFYLFIILPLYWLNVIGNPYDKFLGIDRLLVGIIFGSIILFYGVELHNLLKKKNDNKVYFPFQKVVVPVSFLIITSVIFYGLIC